MSLGQICFTNANFKEELKVLAGSENSALSLSKHLGWSNLELSTLLTALHSLEVLKTISESI